MCRKNRVIYNCFVDFWKAFKVNCDILNWSMVSTKVIWSERQAAESFTDRQQNTHYGKITGKMMVTYTEISEINVYRQSY